jgi:very-short-patch-repair endonuclease
MSAESFSQHLEIQAAAFARRQGADVGVDPETMRTKVHRVERPHGLPAARRQARIRQRTGNRYLDNLYEEFGVGVEIDGTAAHPADEQWRDKRRDNANAVRGIVTLRFGLLDLGDRRCQTAADVAAVLRKRGWTGDARPCSNPTCAIRAETP